MNPLRFETFSNAYLRAIAAWLERVNFWELYS